VAHSRSGAWGLAQLSRSGSRSTAVARSIQVAARQILPSDRYDMNGPTQRLRHMVLLLRQLFPSGPHTPRVVVLWQLLFDRYLKADT